MNEPMPVPRSERRLRRLQLLQRNADVYVMRLMLHDTVEQPVDRLRQHDVHSA